MPGDQALGRCIEYGDRLRLGRSSNPGSTPRVGKRLLSSPNVRFVPEPNQFLIQLVPANTFSGVKLLGPETEQSHLLHRPAS